MSVFVRTGHSYRDSLGRRWDDATFDASRIGPDIWWLLRDPMSGERARFRQDGLHFGAQSFNLVGEEPFPK